MVPGKRPVGLFEVVQGIEPRFSALVPLAYDFTMGDYTNIPTTNNGRQNGL